MSNDLLPGDVIRVIASTQSLSLEDIFKLSLTCRRYYELIWSGDVFWSLLTDRRVVDALKYCVKVGRHSVVEILLRQDIQTNIKVTAFNKAAKLGHAAIVTLLKPHVKSQQMRFRALYEAARQGHVEVTRALVKTGRVAQELIALIAGAGHYNVFEAVFPCLPYKSQNDTDRNMINAACYYAAVSGQVKLL